MQKLFLLLISFIILTAASPQASVHLSSPKLFQPKETSSFFKLGERLIQIKMIQYGSSRDKVYINLHDDELTAVTGAKKLLEKVGGYMIKIENNKTRNIRFKMGGKYYTVDPNRIFSRVGIARSLIIFGNTSPKAIDEIDRFANHILKLIPSNVSWIIALHNNTNGKYSINSYLPGGEREQDAKGLNVNQDRDADDFFLTTDSILYSQLAGEKYNTIWQDNVNDKKDGSLSVYCGERNIHYVNCETEHGRQAEYDQMIVTAVKKLDEKNNEVAVPRNDSKSSYNYRVLSRGQQFLLTSNTDIFFGDKKVGVIRTVFADSSSMVTGKIEMNKDFRLYSNMDFFLFLSSNNSPHLEVRIDPTRRKELINPLSSTISITAKPL